MSKLTIRHLVLAAAPLLVLACSSNDNNSSNGTGGSSAGTGGASAGTGGASAGTGGTTAGTGGASAGTGGTTAGTGGATAGTGGTTAGTGGATAGTGGMDGGVTVDGGIATCATASATSPLISDFAVGTTAVSDQAVGGTDVWTASPALMATVTVTAGEMHVATTGGDWASTSTLLAAKQACVNVAAHTGISFKIRSPSNTALIFEILTPETSADSSGFRTTVTITPTATTVMVPFASLVKAPFGVGMTLPATYKPAEHAWAIAFGVGVMTEKLDLFLDDVTFY